MDFVSRTQHTRSLRREARSFESFACRRRLGGSAPPLKKLWPPKATLWRGTPSLENFWPPKAAYVKRRLLKIFAAEVGFLARSATFWKLLERRRWFVATRHRHLKNLWPPKAVGRTKRRVFRMFWHLMLVFSESLLPKMGCIFGESYDEIFKGQNQKISSCSWLLKKEHFKNFGLWRAIWKAAF